MLSGKGSSRLSLLAIMIQLIVLVMASTNPPSHHGEPSSGTTPNLGAIQDAFYDANIPQDMNFIFDPIAELTITWPAMIPGDKSLTTPIGAHIKNDSTAHLPIFTLLGPSRRLRIGPYIIFMLDPDAPSRTDPSNRSIRHFIGCNYYLTSGDHILRNTTDAPSKWHRPFPFAGTGEHRFVFLVFNQPYSFDWTVVYETGTHEHFNIENYALENDLGHPIAGSFLQISSSAPVSMV